MFASLIKNTAISAVAFLLVSVLGLLLVPYLIQHYGVAGFGVISLARLFVPLMGLGLFDLGFGELSTQAVARSRGLSTWSHGLNLLTLNLVVSFFVGGILGVSLYFLAPSLVGLFSIEGPFAHSLNEALKLTALFLPLMFSSLVFEGVIKGFENFKLQRMIEVFSTLIYTAGAIYCIWQELSLFWVCAMFVLAQVCRAIFAFLFALRSIRPFISDQQVRPLLAFGEFKLRSPSLAFNKVLGTVQANGPVFLIGALLGPASAGVYEALSRIPRFAKSIVGLINATVQPLAIRIDNETKGRDMAKLVGTGTILLSSVVVPLYAIAMINSKPILGIWLNSEMANLWYWQAGLFVSPIFTAIAGFGAAALIGRVASVRYFNRVAVVYIAIQLVLGVALIPVYDEFGFVVSQVVAAAVSFSLQMHFIVKSLDLGTIYIKRFALIFVSVFFLSIFALPMTVRIEELWQLMVSIPVLALSMCTLCLFLTLEPIQRIVFFQTLKSRIIK